MFLQIVNSNVDKQMSTRTIRPAAFTYVALAGFWVAISMIGIYVAFSQNRWDFPVFWLGLFAAFSSCFLISRYRIVVSGGEIRYRSPLSKRTIKLDDIDRVAVAHNTSGALKATMLLLFFEKEKKQATLEINAKMFGMKKVKWLIQTIQNKAEP
jgi:hypothetical protein